MSRERKALEQCLSALLRMIPDAIDEHGLDHATDIEHNAAIEAGAIALYGEDRATWPHGLRQAAEGEYE